MTRSKLLLFGSLVAALTALQPAPSAWEQLQGMAIPCRQGSF